MTEHEHEHALVHENVLTENDPMQFGGEDVAPSVDRGACHSSGRDTSGAASPEPSHTSLLTDAKRYRKRAQAAEKALDDLKNDLAAREKTLHEHEQTIATMQRRQQLDELLQDTNAIDLHAARVLAELALDQMQEPDMAQAVSELRRSKPYLFRQEMRRGKAGSGAMSAHHTAGESPRAAAVENAAAEALETGKRIDLLRYLRLRRKV